MTTTNIGVRLINEDVLGTYPDGEPHGLWIHLKLVDGQYTVAFDHLLELTSALDEALEGDEPDDHVLALAVELVGMAIAAAEGDETGPDIIEGFEVESLEVAS